MLRNKTIIIFSAAALFGLAGGLTGSLLARVYLFEKMLDIPLFGDIDLSQNPMNRPSVVISGARNVVVEQDVKVQDTLKAAAGQIVGIFPKNILASGLASTSIDIKELYDLAVPAGQGLVVSSDGWIISAFTPKSILDRLPGKQRASSTDPALAEFVVITNNRKLYPLSAVIYDPETALSFYRIEGQDLPISGFSRLESVGSGKTAIAANWQKQGWATVIIGHVPVQTGRTISSDDYRHEYILEQAPPPIFNGSFVFALDNSLIGLIDGQGRARPVDNFLSGFNHLLAKQVLGRPFLGLNYIDLSGYFSEAPLPEEFGALVSPDSAGLAVLKNSPADRAGLRANDLILAVNNIELKNGLSLNREIGRKLPGDEISLLVRRAGEVQEFKVILGKK